MGPEPVVILDTLPYPPARRTVSMTGAISSVSLSSQLTIYRLYQSITAARHMCPCFIGMYVMSMYGIAQQTPNYENGAKVANRSRH